MDPDPNDLDYSFMWNLTNYPTLKLLWDFNQSYTQQDCFDIPTFEYSEEYKRKAVYNDELNRTAIKVWMDEIGVEWNEDPNYLAQAPACIPGGDVDCPTTTSGAPTTSTSTSTTADPTTTTTTADPNATFANTTTAAYVATMAPATTTPDPWEILDWSSHDYGYFENVHCHSRNRNCTSKGYRENKGVRYHWTESTGIRAKLAGV
jgi:hypothetical protein